MSEAERNLQNSRRGDESFRGINMVATNQTQRIGMGLAENL